MYQEIEPDLVHDCSLMNGFNVEIRANQGYLISRLTGDREMISFCPYCGANWEIWSVLPHMTPAEYEQSKKNPNSI